VTEENAYTFAGPALKMWLWCIPPLLGWTGLAWVVFTHEKVTCFNYERVLRWYEEHAVNPFEDASSSDEDDEEAVLALAGGEGKEGDRATASNKALKGEKNGQFSESKFSSLEDDSFAGGEGWRDPDASPAGPEAEAKPSKSRNAPNARMSARPISASRPLLERSRSSQSTATAATASRPKPTPRETVESHILAARAYQARYTPARSRPSDSATPARSRTRPSTRSKSRGGRPDDPGTRSNKSREGTRTKPREGRTEGPGQSP